ncbi:hypothetical protein DERP_003736 [Dermatophagoides pteronyssinus]|uniref:Uncharacterized protein n=1 Tax=Dermatophagoides pteronyssinus TaxID=6956 RepID=A0ABQ8JLG5_DERPT|nr:hypothetical protein DERP_003736 [Dermatophagoides pteronyssinus]
MPFLLFFHFHFHFRFTWLWILLRNSIPFLSKAWKPRIIINDHRFSYKHQYHIYNNDDQIKTLNNNIITIISNVIIPVIRFFSSHFILI